MCEHKNKKKKLPHILKNHLDLRKGNTLNHKKVDLELEKCHHIQEKVVDRDLKNATLIFKKSTLS